MLFIYKKNENMYTDAPGCVLCDGICRVIGSFGSFNIRPLLSPIDSTGADQNLTSTPAAIPHIYLSICYDI